jgi:hypothetical protein
LREGAAALQIAAVRLQEAEAQEKRLFGDSYFGASVAAARERFNAAIDDVLGFYGVAAKTKTSESGIKYKPNGKVSVETEVALNNVIELGKNGGGISYLSPGTMVDKRRLPGGVNVYVLGPPRGSLINKSNPSAGRDHETYFGIDRAGLTSFIDGLLQLGAVSGSSPSNVQGPFGAGVGMTAKQAQNDPFFKRTYFASDEAYRRIENSWLDVAGQFALQLDGAINNTSLVLAIELEKTGKVLLFPGDAQVGSWLSWHDHEWKVQRGDKTETITAEDLLRNTVLYKVSHHGSHNATIKEKGLEMMTHPDLVAMVPEQEECYNGIPYGNLMERLNQVCRGRVLVSADVNFPAEEVVKKRPAKISAEAWKAFKANLTIERVYIEYTIE